MLGGQLHKTVPVGKQGLDHLEFAVLPFQHFVDGAALFHQPQHVARQVLHLAGLAIQKVKVVVVLHLKGVDDLLQLDLHRLIPNSAPRPQLSRV